MNKMAKKWLILLCLLPVLGFSQVPGANKALRKAKTDTLRLHPIGDSITRGKSGDTYRHYLRKRIMQEMGVAVDFVGSCPHAPDSNAGWADYPAIADSLGQDLEHDGWGGLKIHEITNAANNTQGYPNFTIEELLKNYSSDFILLMIGTNDLYFYYQANTAWIRLDTLIQKIVNNTNSHLTVSSIPPTYLEMTNARIRSYNTAAQQIVNAYRAQGKKVSFVDVNSRMTLLDLLSDVVHPNSQGNKKIADCYFEGIQKVLTGVESDQLDTQTPTGFHLEQNYPNPFNSGTSIRFSLHEMAFVTLKVYDLLGREIRTCLSEVKQPGQFSYRFDAGDLASGIYVYRMNAGRSSVARNFLLVR
jgi:lysophospholipase L1-like esterase